MAGVVGGRVEPTGDAEDGGHLPHALLIAGRKRLKVGVLALGIGAAMVAGHVGDQLELVRRKALQHSPSLRWAPIYTPVKTRSLK